MSRYENTENIDDSEKHTWDEMDTSVNNMCTFLKQHVGLEARHHPWDPVQEPKAAPWEEDASAFRLVVFIIRSKAAAVEFVHHWSHIVPSACTVLVCDFRFAELTTPRLSKRMLISIGPQCVCMPSPSPLRTVCRPPTPPPLSVQAPQPPSLTHSLPSTPPTPHLCLRRNGVSEYSAYRGDGETGEGLVSAIFDSLGAKVGAAFVEASNPSKLRAFGVSSGGSSGGE